MVVCEGVYGVCGVYIYECEHVYMCIHDIFFIHSSVDGH